MREVYIITGICGHLGNTVAKQLVSCGKSVRGLALPGESSSMLSSEVALTRGNVCDIESLEPLFDGITEDERVIFIHAAGLISITTKKKDPPIYNVNVGGTQNIIELCKKHNVSKLVYISSVHAIPEKPHGTVMSEINSFDPDLVVGAYSRSKAMATQLVLDAANSGLDATVVHPSGIVGPNDYCDGLMGQLIKNYLNGVISACIKGGYDFVDVRDVANAVIKAAQQGKRGECYILSNRYYDALDMLNMVHQITGKRAIKVILPLWFVKAFVPLAGLYFRMCKQKPLFTEDSLHILSSNSAFSHVKAELELGFTTRDMKQTIHDTVLFLQDEGMLKQTYLGGDPRPIVSRRKLKPNRS
ncbi:MAG: NAD-dependent epimerase/dehydratase family protein [Clostridia bacterium]